MACLTYKPSPVEYENTQYSRHLLIETKQAMIQNCLKELKHLDLGNIEQAMYAKRVEEIFGSNGSVSIFTKNAQSPPETANNDLNAG